MSPSSRRLGRKRAARRSGPRASLSRQLVATQGDSAAFRGQQVTVLDLAGDVQMLVSAAGGTLAYNKIMQANSLVGSFHAFYNSVFQEYRIRQVRFDICPVTGFAGVTLFRFDEVSAAAPALTDMESSTSVMRPNTTANSKSLFSMTWTPRNLSDLGFISINGDLNVCNFKIYTDSANLGAPNASSSLWIIRPYLRVEFRGIGGV